MSKFKIGDLVKSNNNYEGVVFAISCEDGIEYVHYAETRNNWVMSEGHEGQHHKEAAKHLTHKNKGYNCFKDACECSGIGERLDRLMEYLKVEEVTNPEVTTIQKKAKP